MDRPSDPPDNEAQLLRRARRGDRVAWTTLYQAHAQAVYALALRLTGNRAAAEDISQETFLKMLQFLSGFRDDAPLRPWLKRIAANAAIDRLRAERHFASSDAAIDWPAADGATTERIDALGLLQRLPPLARTVLWLHEMEGWSHAELARRFGRSESWSKSVLSRALQKLRAALQGEHTDDH